MGCRFAAVCVLLQLSMVASGRARAADIRLGLQVRPRLEKSFIGNVGVQPGGENYRITQRTRATLEGALDVATVRVSLQDVRTWASEKGTLSDFSADNLDLHEAWAALGNDWFTLRVGRQEIALNEQRLIGAPNFAQQNRSFDALRMTLGEEDSLTIDLVASRLQDGDLPQDLLVLNVAIPFGEPRSKLDLQVPLHLQTNAMVAEKERGANRKEWNRFTGGVFVGGKFDQFSWRAEGYGQFGKNPQTNGDHVAFMFGARLGYEFFSWLRPVLWVDYLSGDTDHTNNDQQVESFDTLFPAGHGFYGLMDRFLNIPRDTKDGGLLDVALKNKGELGPGKLVTDVHFFMFAQENSDGQNGPLGVEVDLVYALPLAKRVDAVVGFSLFFDAGDFTAKRDPVTRAWVDKNKTIHDFFYLTLDVKI